MKERRKKRREKEKKEEDKRKRKKKEKKKKKKKKGREEERKSRVRKKEIPTVSLTFLQLPLAMIQERQMFPIFPAGQDWAPSGFKGPEEVAFRLLEGKKMSGWRWWMAFFFFFFFLLATKAVADLFSGIPGR